MLQPRPRTAVTLLADSNCGGCARSWHSHKTNKKALSRAHVYLTSQKLMRLFQITIN